MEDTPPHVKQLQLAIWLSKSPEERLRITLEDNDALFALWEELRKNNAKKISAKTSSDPAAE